MYACRRTLILAAGSSTLSLTGIGTRSSNFPSSSFSYQRDKSVQRQRSLAIEEPTYLLAHGNQLELVRQREHAEQLQLRHRRPQMLVVHRHRVMRDIVMRRDAAQLGALEPTRRALILDEVALF
jgi:hypothetical protein